MAGQGPHTDGLSQHPLLQCVVGAALRPIHTLKYKPHRKTQASVGDKKERDTFHQIVNSLSSLSVSNISPHVYSTFLSTI